MHGQYAPDPRNIVRVPQPQYAYAEPHNARADSFLSDNDGICCRFGPNFCNEGVGQSRISEQHWTYVGEGRGTHHYAPDYVFAGIGAGAWQPEEKFFANPRSYKCLWILGGLACCFASMIGVLGLAACLSQPGVADWLHGAGHHVHGHLNHAGEHIRGAASAFHGHIKEHGPGYIEHLQNGARTVGHHAGNAARAVHGAVKEHGPGVWEHVKNASHAAHDAIKQHGPGMLEHVKNASSAVHGAVKEHGPGVWEHVKSGASTVNTRIRDGASTLAANNTQVA